MLNKILCATDGSKTSDRAVDFAITLAKERQAALTFLEVVRMSQSDTTKTVFWDSTILGAGDAQLKAEFKAIEGRVDAAGLEQVKYVVTHSRDIPRAVATYAEQHGHDHIIMGSHGHTGVKRLMLGSVAAEVVHSAHCPVTIVR